MTAPPFVPVARQHDYVGNDDAPSNPPLKTLQPLIGTARHLYSPVHHTNAPFNAIAKALAVLKPGLLLVHPALLGLVASG